jgi:hypothetical protein
LIENGDYVKDESLAGLKKVEYIDEVLQNVKIILTASRGKFYPNKDFGSYLKKCNDEPRLEYALSYARQAVSSIDGVYIKSLNIDDDEMIFTVTVNENEGEVRVKFGNDI